MKLLASTFLIFAAFAGAAHADDYADRARAASDAFWQQQRQREQDFYANEIATVRAGVVRFAAKHGGYAKAPEEIARDGHWPFAIHFTTADGLACSGQGGCVVGKPGEIYVTCLDGNLRRSQVVPHGCAGM